MKPIPSIHYCARIFYTSLFSLISVLCFAQSYYQTSGNKCTAYSYREYTFTNTPLSPLAATLDIAFAYCGDYGTLNLDILIDGSWVDLHDVTDNSGISCSYRTHPSITIPTALLNDAINSNGGNVTIRGRINDTCAPGYGCSFMSDPCFNIDLGYHYAPDAKFDANLTATCAGGEVVFTNTSTGPQDAYTWDFGSDATPATATGAGPHTVVYSAAGNKTVSLSIEGNYEISTEIKTNYVSVGNTPSSILIGDAFEHWHNPFNGLNIEAAEIMTGSDGNLYYCGTQNYDLWAAKIAPSGQVIWYERFVAAGNDHDIEDLFLDDQNNLYVAATRNSDYLVAKILNNGSLGWMSTFDGAASGADKAHALTVDESGNVYVTGSSAAANGTLMMTTVKYDNAGNYSLQIDKSSAYDIEGKDIQYSNGSIYVLSSGRIDSGFNSDFILEEYEVQLGLQQWSRTFNGAGFGDDVATTLLLENSQLFVFGETNQGGGANGYTIVAYNLNGFKIWNQDYFPNEIEADAGDFFTAGNDGSLYLGSTINNGGALEAKILKLSQQNGTETWSQTFDGINDTKFRSLAVSSTNVVSLLSLTMNNAGNWDFGISQYADDGTELWWGVYDGCGSIDDVPVNLTHLDGSNEVAVIGHNTQAVIIKYGGEVVAQTIALSLKAFLEGPYNGSLGMMNDKLNIMDYLPLVEPYTNLGFTLENTGHTIPQSALTGATENDNIVDWMVIQFRDKTDLTQVSYSFAVLLQRDGDFAHYDTETQTVSEEMNFEIPADSYYIAVAHRNHLPIMTANAVALSEVLTTVDLSTGLVYGSFSRVELPPGIFGLYAGDMNKDNTIDAADRSKGWNSRNQSGYLTSDATMDGSVDAEDRSKAWNNRNNTGSITP